MEEEKKEKKILTLHLTKEWYDKIISGEKTEEYREISFHWTRQFLRQDAINRSMVLGEVVTNKKRDLLMLGYLDGGPSGNTPEAKKHRWEVLRPFTHVRFLCGYPKDGKPYIEREIEDITVDKPKQGLCPDEWLDKYVYVIKFK